MSGSKAAIKTVQRNSHWHLTSSWLAVSWWRCPALPGPRPKAGSHRGPTVGGREVSPDWCSQATPAGLTNVSFGLTCISFLVVTS